MATLQANPGGSMLWKGITENNHVINLGAGMAVGDGCNTRFWQHRWAVDVPLEEVLSQHLPETVRSLRVRDYWTEGEGWKWGLFADLLPPKIVKRIASFELCPEGELEDRLFWHASNIGCFTLKSALSILRTHEDTTQASIWAKL